MTDFLVPLQKMGLKVFFFKPIKTYGKLFRVEVKLKECCVLSSCNGACKHDKCGKKVGKITVQMEEIRKCEKLYDSFHISH